MNATELGSDMLGAVSELASWNRERSGEELRSFVNTHHALLPDLIDIE